MKAKVRYNHWIPKLISKVMPIEAITLWPYILFTNKSSDSSVLRHEKIHIAQYNECLVVGFLILYLWDYLVSRCRGLDHYDAYMGIRFEQEAYQWDADKGHKRKRYDWVKFKLPRKEKDA